MRTFGRSPGVSRDLDRILVTWFESPVGPLVAGATEKGICLWNSLIGAGSKRNSTR
jgi:hypothetical protein